MEELKSREKALLDKNTKGYYCSKVRYAKLYKEMTATYAPFITKERLEELHHEWNTQKNEAMNTLVASYPPENITVVQNRWILSIVGGVQDLKYEQL